MHLEQITTVCVTYRSAGVIGPMLAGLPPKVPLIVVDNASPDRAALVQRLAGRAGTQLIDMPRNLGFGTACNRGAALVQTPYVLFLNPDAVADAAALAALLDHAARHPAEVAWNPRLIEPDGAQHFKRGSHLLPRAARLPRSRQDRTGPVPVLHGAALMVRRADFDAVGGFDERLFLFYEDDDLSIRLARDRGPLAYVAEAVVRHAGGASSGRDLGVLRLKAWHAGWARAVMLRKHGRRASLAALPAALALRWLRGRGASAERRAEDAAYLRGAWAGLRGQTGRAPSRPEE